MTDQERLEHIKRTKGYLLDLQHQGHIDWLIEKAERVKELEKEQKRLENFIENLQVVHFTELQTEKAENQRYKQTLKDALWSLKTFETEDAKEILVGEGMCMSQKGSESDYKLRQNAQ